MTEETTPSFDSYFYPPNRVPKPGSLHAFFERVPGGLEGLLNFLAMGAGDDETLAEALDLAQACLGYRKLHWNSFEDRVLYWERICEQVEISSLDFRLAIIRQVDLYSSHLSHLSAIGAQPDLVQTSIKVGMIATDKAFKDRDAIYKHNKFTPVAPQAVINTSSTTNVGVAVQQNLSLSSLPAFDEMASRSIDAIRLEEPKQKVLSAQSAEFDESVVEAIVDEEELELIRRSNG